ncbi:IS66 family transposase, partial [Clostridium sp. MSJ-8]|uniref:IS66 family transposase n=1 Tax=Clostridium sp. MSJ-8 TaxID=2841510 RepID=UPI001C0F1F98
DKFLENQLDEKTKSLIAEMEKKIDKKDEELKSKNDEINNLKNELAYLKAQLANRNKKIFSSSSEKVDPNQLSLFNEAEKESNSNIEEPVIEEVCYTRKKPSKNTGKKDNLEGLEKVIIEHKLSEEEAICKECGSPLEIIGVNSTKQVLKFDPARLYVEEHITYSYACRKCEADNINSNIITTKAPKNLINKGMASNNLLSHVISLKFLYSVPLYRQESYFNMLGATLSRQTLSNWVIGVATELTDVYNLMKDELLKSNYVQVDETTLKVIEHNGNESKAKKYMWLYKTGSSRNPIILYDYQKTRSSSCPKEFLKGFSGFLQTDGYQGYNKVENVKRVYCLAHIRRKFHEIVENLSDEALKNSRAIIGFNYCEQIYKLEKDIREQYGKDDDYFQKRYEIRLEKLAPILEDFEKYINIEIKDALPRSPLGKALEYAQKTIPTMKNVLEDGSLEIDNNAAERAIKPFVIGRKNWLFANTAKGAKASATIYSIIETAKANNLKIERYLSYLFDNLSNMEVREKNSLLELMPWSDTIPEELKLKSSK